MTYAIIYDLETTGLKISETPTEVRKSILEKLEENKAYGSTEIKEIIKNGQTKEKQQQQQTETTNSKKQTEKEREREITL